MEYLHFTFDGISSQTYSLLIQNKGEDLSHPSQPTFENQIVSPLYQGTSYLAGVNKKDRVFSFNCWANALTLEQSRSMLNWLSVYKVGKLSLDYNPDFFYNVKISTISDFKHMPINNDNTVNYEFTITFTTLEEIAAQSNTLFTTVNTLGPNGLLCGLEIGEDIYFYNTYSLPYYLNLSIVSTTGILIKKNDITYYNYPTTGSYTLNTKYGFCLDNSGKLIEESLSGIETTNLGPMSIDNSLKTIGATVVNGELVTTDILLPTYLIFVSGDNTYYNVSNYNNLIADLSLLEGETIILNCFIPVKINLSPGITYSFRLRDNF